MGKTVWILNHYAELPVGGVGERHYSLAKRLNKQGHHCIIFNASTVHNTNINYVTDRTPYIRREIDGVEFVSLKARNYTGNGKARVLNMLDYYFGLMRHWREFEKPDVIYASSVHPLALVAGIRLAKKLHVKCVCEVRDLWPESLISYGFLKRNSLPAAMLYSLEKWIYKHADKLIFTMAGGAFYVESRHWGIDQKKIFYINNGVDLAAFDKNVKTHAFPDPDLDNDTSKKVLYTGSLGTSDAGVQMLCDAAPLLKKVCPTARILIYGRGDHEEELIEHCRVKGYSNVVFKGFVDKNRIPYILSKANCLVVNCACDIGGAYGGSQNKLFEYLASGKSILSGEQGQFSVVANEGCGISHLMHSPQDVADALAALIKKPVSSRHIRAVAKTFDYGALAKKLAEILEIEEEKHDRLEG